LTRELLGEKETLPSDFSSKTAGNGRESTIEEGHGCYQARVSLTMKRE